jgi:hypothetical protein
LGLEDIGVCTPSMETEKSHVSHVSHEIDYTTASLQFDEGLIVRQGSTWRTKLRRALDEMGLYTALLAGRLASG